MKVILSKKGLDSSNSEKPVQIIDNKMLFLPIPSEFDTDRYSETFIDKNSLLYHCTNMGINYGYINNKKMPIDDATHCHLNPQLVNYFNRENFKGSFGQVLAAQRHLENNHVEIGDLFLFYGWYADKNKPNGKHTLFGYLQVGEIIKVNELTKAQKTEIQEKYPFVSNQPHWTIDGTNNTIYIASDICTFDGSIPGYGMFTYSPDLDLTATDQENKTYWHIPALKNCQVSFSGNGGTKQFNELGQFRVADRCQELVLEECDQATQWAINLIRKHAKR